MTVTKVNLVAFGGESPRAPGADLGDSGIVELPESAWTWLASHGFDDDGDPRVWVAVMDDDEARGAEWLPNYVAQVLVILTEADAGRYQRARVAAELAEHVNELVDAAEAAGVDWD